MRLSSSRLKVFSCIPRCLPRQSGAVNFAGWAFCRVTKLFKICFTDVDVAGSFVVTVMRFGSGKSVETSPGFGSQGVPRTFYSNLWSYRCSSATRLTDCPVSSITMRSVVFARTHLRTRLPTTSTPTCVECAFGGQRTHQSSATQLSGA